MAHFKEPLYLSYNDRNHRNSPKVHQEPPGQRWLWFCRMSVREKLSKKIFAVNNRFIRSGLDDQLYQDTWVCGAGAGRGGARGVAALGEVPARRQRGDRRHRQLAQSDIRHDVGGFCSQWPRSYYDSK